MDPRFLTGAIERAGRPGRPRLEILGEPPPPVASVGMVAGSFDPMTVAHAALLGALGTELGLLVWSPATLPKERGVGGAPAPPLLGSRERLASLVAWCERRPWARAATCSHGLLADQAEAAAASFPRARLVLGMGSDKLLQLLDPAWYEDRDAVLRRLFDRVEVAVALRSGDGRRLRAALDREPRWAGRVHRIDPAGDFSAISSRAVREAIRRGEDVSGAVPPEIARFVRAAAG